MVRVWLNLQAVRAETDSGWGQPGNGSGHSMGVINPWKSATESKVG